MKQLKKIFCLILFISQSATAWAQFSLPVFWTGGTGGGNTDVCGPNVITFTADPIPAGLTYQWVTYDYDASCGVNYNSQPLILSTGSPVLVYGMTGIVQCFAIDSAGQVQLQSFDIPMFNPDFNDGICSQNAVGGTVSICTGDSALLRITDFAWNGSLSVNGPGSVQWQLNGINIPGANNLSYYATLPGTYKVLFSLSCGSGFSNEIQVISLSNPPTPTILGDFNFCQGSSTVLTANGAFSSYLWSTGETTQAITVNTDGPYTVSVSNAAGCTSMATAVVTENPNPVPNITGNNLICQGSTAVLDAGAGFTAYLWSPGSMTQTVNVGLPGPYTVWVTDVNGCTGSDTFVLNVNPAPVPQITGNTILCLPQTTTLDAGGGYSLYQWNIGTVSQTITVSSIGTLCTDQ